MGSSPMPGTIFLFFRKDNLQAIQMKIGFSAITENPIYLYLQKMGKFWQVEIFRGSAFCCLDHQIHNAASRTFGNIPISGAGCQNNTANTGFRIRK